MKKINVRNAEEKIALLRAKLNEFSLPKSGNIGELRENLELINIARAELSACKESLEIAKKEVLHYEHKYKNANLEYEKMKYLEKEEFKKALQPMYDKYKKNFGDDLFNIADEYNK